MVAVPEGQQGGMAGLLQAQPVLGTNQGNPGKYSQWSQGRVEDRPEGGEDVGGVCGGHGQGEGEVVLEL